MVVREQSLVVETVQQIRAQLPFVMLGLDVDNDSAFINETMLAYCQEQGLEFTRSRAYRKNDQAWNPAGRRDDAAGGANRADAGCTGCRLDSCAERRFHRSHPGVADGVA
jgi:hypothetical protein